MHQARQHPREQGRHRDDQQVRQDARRCRHRRHLLASEQVTVPFGGIHGEQRQRRPGRERPRDVHADHRGRHHDQRAVHAEDQRVDAEARKDREQRRARHRPRQRERHAVRQLSAPGEQGRRGQQPGIRERREHAAGEDLAVRTRGRRQHHPERGGARRGGDGEEDAGDQRIDIALHPRAIGGFVVVQAAAAHGSDRLRPCAARRPGGARSTSPARRAAALRRRAWR